MPAPSYTYTLTNSTTADASQVMQNYNDILNGVTDGTKDLSISALTCAGTVTFNGNVTLGNASSDDLTVTGSLASSIPIKTTFSYDIGSATIGLRSAYLGSNDSAARSVRVIAGVIASSYTLTLPISAGTAGQSVVALGSGSTIFLGQSPSGTQNLGLAASVGSSILTVALKGADGNDASATNPVYITFRNATSATGTPVTRAVTGSLSVQASSGSTLGHASALAANVWVYAIDNAGTVELALSGQKLFDEGGVVTTTAEGGAGAADSAIILYSTTARSNVACRLLGRLTSTQATAGTWATTPSVVALAPITKTNTLFAAHATGSPGSTTANTPLIFPTATRNADGAYSTSTGKYTTLRMGWYQVSIHTQSSFNAGNYLYVSVNASTTVSVDCPVIATTHANSAIMTGTALVYVGTVGHTIDIRPVVSSTGGAATDWLGIVWLGD